MPKQIHSGLFLSAACIALMSAPAHADEIVFNTGHTENCIQFSENYADCSGKSSGVCSDANTYGGTMAGMAKCTRAELQFWETKMAELASIAEALSANSSDAEASAFKKMHETWVNFRNADCAYNSINYEAADAAIAIPLCKMNMTASQVQYLEQILGEME